MIAFDLVDLARERTGITYDRDCLSIRLADGVVLVWDGPWSDENRTLLWELPEGASPVRVGADAIGPPDDLDDNALAADDRARPGA